MKRETEGLVTVLLSKNRCIMWAHRFSWGTTFAWIWWATL